MLIARAVGRSLRAVTVAKPHFRSHDTSFVAAFRIIRPVSTSTPVLYPKTERSEGEEGRADSLKDGDSLHGGSLSRTDDEVKIPHPGERNMPRSVAGAGRSGFHFKRTLASFSLEGRVAVMTGGARGLGLVMAQALIVSGADVAIVDLNSKQD